MSNAINNPGMSEGPAAVRTDWRRLRCRCFAENPREAPEINFQLAFKILLC